VSPAAVEPRAPKSSGAAPPSAEDFATAITALGPFETAPVIAVGVSGGPDSTALALLLQDWVAARGGRLLALVVDHRLRPDSTDEAALVAGRLAERGIEARVLTREGELPRSGLQAAARAARYALLEQATAAEGILHLAVAHHLEDQRETMALRLAAGSGPRGAAGMATVRELDRVRLIRPLLGMAPARLKALLAQHGQPWLDDPSNRDPRFWRARHRAVPPAAPPSVSPASAAAARRALDRAVAALLARYARPHPLGFVLIETAPLKHLERRLLEQLLGRLVLATSGSIWPPGRAKLARLAAWLLEGTGQRTALGGVLVERTSRALRFVREPRAVAGPARLPAEGMLWDGRFRITRRGPVPALEVRPAGPGWRGRLAQTTVGGVYWCKPSEVSAVVLETLPLVSSGDRALALGPWCLEPLGRGLDIRFRPRNRYAAVPFDQSVSPSVA
jgi:tRNA(Ile)-lysidine synthase